MTNSHTLAGVCRPASLVNLPSVPSGIGGPFPAWERNLQTAHAACRQPCGAHGWHWPSQTEAARALGVPQYAVTRALNRGTFPSLVHSRLGVNAAAVGFSTL